MSVCFELKLVLQLTVFAWLQYWPYRGEIDIVEYVNAYTLEDFGHEVSVNCIEPKKTN